MKGSMNYSMFCLAELLRIKYPDLETDLLWDLVQKHYVWFRESEYDNPNQSEYDCMEAYVMSLKGEPNV